MDWNSLFLCCLLRERIFLLEFQVFFAQISRLYSDKFSTLQVKPKDLAHGDSSTPIDHTEMAT